MTRWVDLFWSILLLVNMFSLEINFIRKELPEATVISRITQLIKRTPFDIWRRRDDDKINYAELQLRLSCVHGRYDQIMRHAKKSQNINEFFGDIWECCVESWNLWTSLRHVHQTTVAKISPFMIYTVQRSTFSTLVHILVASCKRVFTHAGLCVKFPFNPNFNVAKAL